MILLWYPKCSTCQKAKKYLDNHNCEYELKDITKDTPNISELKDYVRMSGKELKKFFNTSGMKYREYNLKEKIPSMSDEEMFSLLASDGMLIKRPILICNNHVCVGFKEKEWSDFI